jgi:putative ABC transport system substrate-binding protein
MRRRHLAASAAAALLALPTIGRAQLTAKPPRIGWIWHGRSIGPPQEVTGFRQGLKEFGYVEGQTIVVDYRFTEGRSDRIAGLAAELIQMQPDVLVVVGLLVMDAIKDTTGGIPIVLLTGDPVGAGYVASLARPGGQITGVSLMQGAGGLTGKRIDLLKDTLPGATRIGLMFNPNYSIAAAGIRQAQQVASQRQLVLVQAPVRQVNEIEPGAPVLSYQPELGRLLLQNRLPAASELRLLIETGGVFSYGPNIFYAAKRLAYLVDRILKGAKPADLPVEQAAMLELVVNLRIARLLDIEIPPILLARADEVIE